MKWLREKENILIFFNLIFFILIVSSKTLVNRIIFFMIFIGINIIIYKYNKK